MENVFEVVSIKQVTRKLRNKFANYKIKNPQDAAKLAQHYIGSEAQEVFLAIFLNTKNDVIAIHKVHVGALNSSVVHPRECFKAAILNNSASIIFSHNHPSGNTSPSPEDIEVTKRLQEAGFIIGIEVIDHIIVSHNEHTSLREKGYI